MNEQNQNLPFKISTTITYFFLYVIANLCFFISGLTFSNILHFSIEDKFNQPTEFNILFGREYAFSLSWLLITSLTYMALMFIIKHNANRYSEIFFNKSRIYTLNTFLYISCIFTFFYIVNIIYSFFSGHSDTYGLLRIAVTLTLLIFGILYIFIESRYFAISKSKSYLFGLLALFCIIDAGSINLTFKYASPQLLRVYERDVQKISDIKTIVIGVKRYYQNFNQLPVALNALNNYGFLSSISALEDYEYKMVTDQSFDTCTTFEENSEAARRISRVNKPFGYHFKKGPQCKRFFIEKTKEGGFVLKSDFSSNITIQLYGNE